MSDLDLLMALDERELISTRVYDAPPDRVWRCWRDPALLSEWWGPRGFANTTHEFEFKTGGVWRLTMHGPDGADYPNIFDIRSVEAERHVVLEHQGAPRFLLLAAFDPVGSGTKVTFRQLFDGAETCRAVRDICLPANEDNLDRLGAVLVRLARQSH